MATIFINGSTTGLGAMAGKQLGLAGHLVIFHARHQERAAVLRQPLRPAAFGSR
jgi:short-subunit dehydrogenase